MSFDHFVAMHRPLLQQPEQGVFHVATSEKATTFFSWPKRLTASGPPSTEAKRAAAAPHFEKVRTMSLLAEPGRRPIIPPLLVMMPQWTMSLLPGRSSTFIAITLPAICETVAKHNCFSFLYVSDISLSTHKYNDISLNVKPPTKILSAAKNLRHLQ